MPEQAHTDREVSTNDQESLEGLYEDAEEAREQFSSAQERLKRIKSTLRDHVRELESGGLLDVTDVEQLDVLIDRGEYGKVRESIREARRPLEFDDDEKDAFAEKFDDVFSALVDDVEDVRTAILDLETSVDRDDLIDLLYGKYSTLNKGEIEAAFEAIDDVSRTSLDPTQLARVLQAFDSSLKIQPTADVLEAIKKEAGR